MAEYAQQMTADPEQEDEGQQQHGDTDLLISAIEEREGTAIGREADPISLDRAKALDYYLGSPLGNEIDGRSQVVSKDLFDTVEWIKPSLLRIFAGGDDIAKFTPQTEADVKPAEQESDYVNYMIQRKNDWFAVCNEWFTDALITRNAYCWAYWCMDEQGTLERYEGLTDDQLVLIAMDPGVQIVAHKAYGSPPPIPAPMMLNAISQGMQQGFPQPQTLHDVDVRRTGKSGRVKLEVLPPERCLVSQDSRGVSLQEVNFFEYWDKKTLSELRNEGFQVEDDISDSSTSITDQGIMDQTRDWASGAMAYGAEDKPVDPSMRKVKVRCIWIRHDFDGDGKAELRYVVLVGKTVLWNQETPTIPVAAIVPYPMPHRHIGLSMFDAVGDLQRIKTAMQRQVIDNAYLANNSRTAVDKNLVNLDDMAVARPGGIVRVDGPPQTAVMPFPQPQTAQHGITVLQYFDEIRADRGGVQKPYGGSDLQAIQAQPGTVAQLSSIASQKVEQVARVLASGVRELFLIVHQLTLTHGTQAEKVQLRNQWVSVDPRTWKKREDMTLLVGLGITNRQAHLAAISALLGLQEKALGVGLTRPSKIYNALAEYTKAMGFASAAQFFDEPDPNKPFEPSPPYQVIVAEINAQAQTLINQMKISGDASIATLKEEAAAARTYFQEHMQAQVAAQDRFVRAVSEATDRMQELRLEQARQGETIKGEARVVSERAGMSAKQIQDSVKELVTSATAASSKVEGVVAALEGIKKKTPTKRVITAPSGKQYQVEDLSSE